MKRLVVTFAVLSFFIGGLFSVVPGVAHAKPIQLTYSGFWGPTHPISKLAESWIKEVEKRTNGQVKIIFYPGQTLTKAAVTYDAVVNGLADIGLSCLQYNRGRFPIMDVINLPLGYPSGAVTTAIVNEIFEKFAPEELSDTKIFYLHSHGPGFIHTKGDPIRKMEDLKGMKIRSHGPTAEMLKCLGGTPVALPMPELYQALQKGVVQGGICPMEGVQCFRISEVTNTTLACYDIAYSLAFFVNMNKAKWDSLPADVQKVIEEVNQEWIIKTGQAWDWTDHTGFQFDLSCGNTIVGVDAKEAKRMKKAVRPVVDMYLKQAKDKGIDAKPVLDYVEKRLKDAKNGKFKSKYM